MSRSINSQRLVVLFLVGLVLLNAPFLSIFNQEKMVWGIPILFVYLFGVWLFIVISLMWVIEHRRIRQRHRNIS